MRDDEVEILLVEDNADDVELTIHALRRDNLANQIHVVRNGEEALAFLFDPQSPNHVHLKLVLLDLKLPKVDGLEVLRKVKSDPRTKSIPVVMMTSSKEEEDLVKSYELGVNSYLQKPVDFDQFRDMVKSMGFYWLLTNRLPPSTTLSGATDERGTQ